MDPTRRVELDGMTARVALDILDGLAALLRSGTLTSDQEVVLTLGAVEQDPASTSLLEAALGGVRESLRGRLDDDQQPGDGHPGGGDAPDAT